MPRGQHERARSGGKDAGSRHGVTSRGAAERRFVTGYVAGVTELVTLNRERVGRLCREVGFDSANVRDCRA